MGPVNPQVLIKDREGQECRRCEDGSRGGREERLEDAALLALKMSQKMQASSETGKGTSPPLKPAEETALETLAVLEFLTSRTVGF